MNIWQQSLKLIRELPPHKQAKALLIGGLINLTLGTSFTFMWREHKNTNEELWSRVPAFLTSKPETWDSDKSLYTFSIKFKTSNGKHHNAHLYAEKIYFDAASLDLNTPLFVDIATSKSAATAQRLIAPNGMFLYDSAMAAHVINVRNRETTLAVIIFSFSGISILIAAAAIYYRPRKECN
ncbi:MULTISPECIES: hypothetical protein [Pseudomonas]|uniref:SMODS-associating 2TM beta-strand rich effector domain-containing protein n=1 Tax=Pseudomonas hunanensis TaxID=1247546 RepID=A0ABD6N6Q0_9PSED|nr:MULTISPECIES: hypothetical protein [Pseudomonas]MDD2146222.1 hypothetical protein [Pseudomonas putida]NWL49149.1 hypothetical protein [Pseudomonas hunanensis]PTV65511.1 hypothetical protein DBL03_03670 [Pseudomonas putida]HDS1709401.1 hypothetical protein [Pseudomonas putida]